MAYLSVYAWLFSNYMDNDTTSLLYSLVGYKHSLNRIRFTELYQLSTARVENQNKYRRGNSTQLGNRSSLISYIHRNTYAGSPFPSPN